MVCWLTRRSNGANKRAQRTPRADPWGRSPSPGERLARSSAGPDTAAADSQQASPRRRGQRQDLPMGLGAVIRLHRDRQLSSPAGGTRHAAIDVDPAGVCGMAPAFALYLLDARTEIWPPLNLGLACAPARAAQRRRFPDRRRLSRPTRESLPVSSYRAAPMPASELPTPAPRTACSITSSPRSHFSRFPVSIASRSPLCRRSFVLAVVIFCCCRSSVSCCCCRCCCCSSSVLLSPDLLLVGALGLCCCWPTHHSWTPLLSCPDRFPGRSRKSGPARSGGPLFLESPGVKRNPAGGWASSLFFSGDQHLENNT